MPLNFLGRWILFHPHFFSSSSCSTHSIFTGWRKMTLLLFFDPSSLFRSALRSPSFQFLTISRRGENGGTPIVLHRTRGNRFVRLGPIHSSGPVMCVCGTGTERSVFLARLSFAHLSCWFLSLPPLSPSLPLGLCVPYTRERGEREGDRDMQRGGISGLSVSHAFPLAAKKGELTKCISARAVKTAFFRSQKVSGTKRPETGFGVVATMSSSGDRNKTRALSATSRVGKTQAQWEVERGR